MKRTLLLAFGLFLTISGRAQQVPNGDFETWNNLVLFEEPQGYLTSNYYSIITGAGGLPRANVFKSTTKQAGTYAMKMESYANPADATKGIPGIAGTGVLDIQNLGVMPGFPYTGRPALLNGYYKYAHGGTSDSAAIGVLFYKNVMGQLEVIGGGYGLLTDAANYTAFSIPILFATGDAPDTAVIGISTSARFDIQKFLDSLDFSNVNVPIGSVLYVDELSFFGGTTGMQPIDQLLSGVSAYPNPVKDQLSISFMLTQPKTVTVKVFNSIGQQIKMDVRNYAAGKEMYALSTEELEAGVYYYQLVINGEATSRKFVVVK